MRVVISGGLGMLAADLVPALRAAGHEPIALGRADLDVTDAAAIARAVADQRPGAWINAAAYTAVDDAEREEARAFAVNATGAGLQAAACAAAGIPFLHVSTDYVFDGQATHPYRASDPTGPRSAYGRTKLAGEVAVQAAHPGPIIVRTSWLYGAGGKNFVDTMRKLGREKPELAVVADQTGGPTWTGALAPALVALLGTGASGTFHLTGAGACTWHDLTRAILEIDGLATPVRPITTSDLGRPAPRPAYSVLDNAAAHAVGVLPLPDWRASLATYMVKTD